ncbi:MAG: N-6 DNA methylase [Acidimicrobiales bacterium]
MTGGPDALVAAYEASFDADARAAGAVYTPRPLADALVAVALSGWEPTDGPAPLVCDPAVGGGTFLLAAADVLVHEGVAPTEVVGSCLWGADVDEAAVDVAVAAVEAWLAGQEGEAATGPARGGDRSRRRPRAPGRDAALAALRSHVVVADSLADVPSRVWPTGPSAGFDVVVGNPPFQDQLTAATARSPRAAAALRRRFGAAVAGYADTAVVFLAAAVDLARPGGRIVLIVPQSVLGARDAAPARDRVLTGARLDGLWTSSGPVFTAAAVEVCAPVLTVADGEVAPGMAPLVARWRGPTVEPVDAVATTDGDGRRGSWSFLTRDLLGVPPSGLPAAATTSRAASAGGTGRDGPRVPTLGSLVRATAGFRDQFYGVEPFVREAAPGHAPRPGGLRPQPSGTGGRHVVPGDGVGSSSASWVQLVTSGLIEPGRCDWGRRPCRFAGRRWDRPVVDLGALRAADGALAAWADRVLVPKVVLATQTTVLEAAVDRTGRWWPSVPVVAVLPDDPSMLDRVAAVLLAPPVSAWAFEQTAGTALARTAVKLAARDVLDVPLPPDDEAWAAAAARVPELASGDEDRARHALDDVGVLMNRAYGADADVLGWWRGLVGRRPRPSGRRRPRSGRVGDPAA